VQEVRNRFPFRTFDCARNFLSIKRLIAVWFGKSFARIEPVHPATAKAVEGYMQDKSERWRRLCELASVEQDPEKLIQLVREINCLLEEKRKRLNGRPESSSFPTQKEHNPPAEAEN
jgi:hypothetical protein